MSNSSEFSGEWLSRYDVFSRREITPANTGLFERRLEDQFRELARLIVQWTLRRIESSDPAQTVPSFYFQGESYRRNRRTTKTIDTRFGSVTFDRWFYQNTEAGESGMAPLDVRLGLFGGRMTPALAEVTARLAADMPQQATLDMLQERFNVRPGLGAYRRIVADVASQVRTVHDDVAIEKLLGWLEQAWHSEGENQVLFQVGRDGVFVQTRPCWEEASCGTLAVFDRNRNRLGTIYLGEMPESEQPTMTTRLTKVILGVLSQCGDQTPALRYVTDAGFHPQAFFNKVLSTMKHPVTGEPLKWSWGVDFFHASEYVAKLAGSLFGKGTEEANEWAETQRHTLRHQRRGIDTVIRCAAQYNRRYHLEGSETDYDSAMKYLKKYRRHMDFAERASRGEPIGSGITEAGCKVIFNQRLKQSGMRWHCETGQYIVDLRTACRSRIWSGVWERIIGSKTDLPQLMQQSL